MEVGLSFAIIVDGNNVEANIQNLNIVANFNNNTNNTNSRGAILTWNEATTNIDNSINVEVSGYFGRGIYSYNKSTINIQSNANIDIKTSGQYGYGIFSNYSSTIIIRPKANINIETLDTGACGLISQNNSGIEVEEISNIRIETKGRNATGIYTRNQSFMNIFGNINIKEFDANCNGIVSSAYNTGNKIHLGSTAQIYFDINSALFVNGATNNIGNNILEIATGAKIAFEKNGNTKWYEVKENYKDENTSAIDNNISADNIETVLKVSETSAWQTAADIIAEQAAQAEEDDAKAQEERKAYQTQFNSALSQFDMLINDSSYKGINLLKDDSLKINFNEDKSANLLVKGVDITSESLGLLSADWKKASDVSQTLEQLSNAKNKLRSAASQLGNYYSIVTTRDEFTENLINVLEEGADKLTLADMNEESANMLSLQTQQQLAINSLSLASQSAQAVLRLF